MWNPHHQSLEKVQKRAQPTKLVINVKKLHYKLIFPIGLPVSQYGIVYCLPDYVVAIHLRHVLINCGRTKMFDTSGVTRGGGSIHPPPIRIEVVFAARCYA